MMNAIQSDSELIREAKRGDNAALQRLFFRHDRKVLTIAARYVQRAGDAKDIYQEVFLRVHHGIRKFEERSEFSTWLFRLTTNVCLTHLQKNRRVSKCIGEAAHGEEEDANRVEEGISPEEESPLQKVADAELRRKVDAALQQLSPRQKMVFILKHYEEHRLSEIAEILECSEGTVKKYLFEAVHRLRVILKEG